MNEWYKKLKISLQLLPIQTDNEHIIRVTHKAVLLEEVADNILEEEDELDFEIEDDPIVIKKQKEMYSLPSGGLRGKYLPNLHGHWLWL